MIMSIRIMLQKFDVLDAWIAPKASAYTLFHIAKEEEKQRKYMFANYGANTLLTNDVYHDNHQ